MRISSIFLLVGAMVSIQSGAAIAKQLFSIVGPSGLTVLRTSLAAVILMAFWRPWKDTWTFPQIKKMALYGCSLGAMNLFFYLSLKTTPLGLAVALEFTGPLTVALFASRKVLDFIWALFAALGILLILPLTSFSAALDLTGALFALGAGGFWALYIIFGKKAGEEAHGGKSTAIGMSFAALVAFPFGVYEAGPQLIEGRVLAWGLAVAILSSALPYSLEMTALKKMPIKTFGILMSLEPVIATIAGVLFLRETLSFSQGIAIGLIVLASLGSTLSFQGPT